MSSNWSKYAELWSYYQSPLRPHPDDLRIFGAAVREWSNNHGAPRALMLGVTPELHDLDWPDGTDLIAADRNPEMIASVWPGAKEAAIESEWTDLPLGDSSRDIVLCDGGVGLLEYPQGQRELARGLKRVLAPGGLFITRLYVPPATREPPEQVLADLLSGDIPNLCALKVRLWTALQPSLLEGVELSAVWEAVHSAAPDLDTLADRLGWSREETHVIDIYRNSPARYWLSGVNEVKQMLCDNPGGFSLESASTPAYALGDRCPILVFRREQE